MENRASLSNAIRKETHVYSDASKDTIAAVAYLKSVTESGETHVGFILGKVKFAPQTWTFYPALGAVRSSTCYENLRHRDKCIKH